VGGGIFTVVLHTVASRLAPKVRFSWVDILKSGRTGGFLLLRLRDILVVLLRALMVFVVLLYPARPFLYRGKPPAEIWVKDVPPNLLREIRERWGEFARIRFSPTDAPSGKVALVGAWSALPSTEYEIWSMASDWEIRDFEATPEGLKLKILNTGKDRWFKILLQGDDGVLLSDSLFVPSGQERTYEVAIPLKGEVSLRIDGRVLHDYILEGKGGGLVVAKGLEREVWEALLKTLGLDLKVGVDTILKEAGSLNFTTDCGLLSESGLKAQPAEVVFVLKDSGCVILSERPVLLDAEGKVVGAYHDGRYFFGFHPTGTGWAFTPDFLRFIPLLSESASKIYVGVGDTVRFAEPVEIRGPTRMCCPETFVPSAPGIYRIYRDGNLRAIVVANVRTSVKIPDPPKPLWPYLLFIFLSLLAFEMLLVFAFRGS